MKPLVTDELWVMVAPLLPRRRAQPKGGRPWVDDRAALNGILYVLRSGIPRRMLPTPPGDGPRAPVGGWPRSAERHPVRAPLGHPVAHAADRARIRLGGDVLAPAPGVATAG